MKMDVPAQPVSLVALLTWVYRDQRAHVNSHVTLSLPIHKEDPDIAPPRLDSACLRLARYGALGADIASTHRHHRPQLHRDAEAVHACVAALSHSDPYGAHLVARHGLWAQAPEFSNDVPIPEPVMRLNAFGRDEIIDDAAAPGNGAMTAQTVTDPQTGVTRLHWVEIPYPFCPLRYWPSPADIAQSRLDYRIWHRALTRLLAILPALARWTVETVGAQANPWDWVEDGALVLSHRA